MDENEQLKGMLNAANAQLQTLYDFISNEKLRTENNERVLLQKFNQIRIHVDNLQSQLNAKVNEISLLNEQLRNVSDEKTSLKTELKTVEENFNAESKKLCEFRLQFDELIEISDLIQTQNIDNDKSLEMLKKENENLKLYIQAQQKQFEDTTSELQAQKAQLDLNAEYIQILTAEVSKLKKANMMLRIESTASKQQFNHASSSSSSSAHNHISQPSGSAQKSLTNTPSSSPSSLSQLTPSPFSSTYKSAASSTSSQQQQSLFNSNPHSNDVPSTKQPIEKTADKLSPPDRKSGDSSYVCPRCQLTFSDRESYASHVTRCS